MLVDVWLATGMMAAEGPPPQSAYFCCEDFVVQSEYKQLLRISPVSVHRYVLRKAALGG